MKKTKIFFIISFIVVISIGSIGCGFKGISKFGENKQTEISNPELEKEYVNKVQEILADYMKKYDTLKNDQQEWGSLVTETQNKILEVTVPSKYKDFHLDLVLSLSLIKQGLSASDEKKLEESENKLKDLYKQITE